jgi:hypothetical protein
MEFLPDKLAYCGWHRRFMTKQEVQAHKCLCNPRSKRGRHCNWLKINQNHSWWKQKQAIKKRKKERKQQAKEAAI